MEDIWFNTTLFKSMPHVSANVKSNHKAHKTGLVTQGHRMSKQWRKHLDRHFGGTKFQLTKLSNQLTHHDPRLLWHRPVYSHTRELSCISSSVDKVWTVPWRGRVVAFSYLFLYLLFFPVSFILRYMSCACKRSVSTRAPLSRRKHCFFKMSPLMYLTVVL